VITEVGNVSANDTINEVRIGVQPAAGADDINLAIVIPLANESVDATQQDGQTGTSSDPVLESNFAQGDLTDLDEGERAELTRLTVDQQEQRTVSSRVSRPRLRPDRANEPQPNTNTATYRKYQRR